MAGLKRLYELLEININEFVEKADNKEESINRLIIDMENQAERLRYKLVQEKSEEETALRLFEISKRNSKSFEEKARLALNLENQELARKSLEQKYLEDLNLKEKEIIYTTLDAQACQLKEQLETLTFKLEEARVKKDTFLTVNKLHNSIENDKVKTKNTSNNDALKEVNIEGLSCDRCEKTKDIIEAELERLMNEIRANNNLL